MERFVYEGDNHSDFACYIDLVCMHFESVLEKGAGPEEAYF